MHEHALRPVQAFHPRGLRAYDDAHFDGRGRTLLLSNREQWDCPTFENEPGCSNRATLVLLDRDQRSGRLSQAARGPCLGRGHAIKGCRPLRGPARTADSLTTAFSPDGRRLYVSDGERGTALLRRAPNGSWRQPPGAAGCLRRHVGDGCAVARGAAPSAVAVDRSGRTLAFGGGSRVRFFHADRRTGDLTPASGAIDPRGVDFSDLAFSRDGRRLYAIGPAAVALLVRARA